MQQESNGGSQGGSQGESKGVRYVYPIGGGKFRTGYRKEDDESEKKEKETEKESLSLEGESRNDTDDFAWSKPKYDSNKYGGYIESLLGKEKWQYEGLPSLLGIPTDQYLEMQEWIIEKIIEHEGGYSDHANDKGGKTNFGISWSTWNNFAKSTLGVEPTEENLKDITADDAKEIYRENFWKPGRIDEIENVDMKYAFFDFYINTNVGATRSMQEVLNDEFGMNLEGDGVFGSQTIEAMNSVDQKELYNHYVDARADYYRSRVEDDPTQKIFLEGWLNRVDKFRLD